jgi:hypothetical protein
MVGGSNNLEPSTFNTQLFNPNYLRNGLLRFSCPMVVSGPWPL